MQLFLIGDDEIVRKPALDHSIPYDWQKVMNILITGGKGFLAGRVYELFKKKNLKSF